MSSCGTGQNCVPIRSNVTLELVEAMQLAVARSDTSISGRFNNPVTKRATPANTEGS